MKTRQMNRPPVFHIIGKADTPQALINFAGIYYHNHNLTADRVIEVLLDRGNNPEWDADYQWIWHYLDGVAPGTLRADFENNIQQQLPGYLRFENTQIPVVAETIEAWFDGRLNR